LPLFALVLLSDSTLNYELFIMQLCNFHFFTHTLWSARVLLSLSRKWLCLLEELAAFPPETFLASKQKTVTGWLDEGDAV